MEIGDIAKIYREPDTCHKRRSHIHYQGSRWQYVEILEFKQFGEIPQDYILVKTKYSNHWERSYSIYGLNLWDKLKIRWTK
jgi:hypothetical protein